MAIKIEGYGYQKEGVQVLKKEVCTAVPYLYLHKANIPWLLKQASSYFQKTYLCTATLNSLCLYKTNCLVSFH